MEGAEVPNDTLGNGGTLILLPTSPNNSIGGGGGSSTINNNNNNRIQQQDNPASDSYSSSSSSSSTTSSSSSQQDESPPTAAAEIENNNNTLITDHNNINRKHSILTTPIKSNFLTKEEEEENQEQIIHSSRDEQQEKQQEELLALQNQIFLSQTNVLNTSNITNISMIGTTNASSMSNHDQIVKTPPSRNRILSNVSSGGLNQDSPIIGTRDLTPSKHHLTSPKGSEKSSSRHFASPLFDSADLEDEKHQSDKLSTLENNVESLKLMKRRHRENYLPETFLHFCKHETSKIYGWSLESEKHSVQFYNKSISLHSLATGDFSAISRLTSQTTLESTSTQDLSKNLRFKQTPMINDSVNFVIANRFVGILSDTNFRDAYLACKDIQLRKQAKQMEEVVVLESYYHVEGPEITDPRKSKVPDESFDIIYQRTSSPNTLFVSKREYLTARYFIEESERFIILERSIEKILPIPSMLQSLTLEHDKILNEVKNQTNQFLSETQSNNSQNEFLSTSPSRQRSRSVGTSNSSGGRISTEIHITPLSARTTTTSAHISQQSAPNLNMQQQYPNDSLKNTLSSNTTQKGVVRANILFQILIFDRLSDTETKFQIINNVDVKGWLKSWNSITQKSTPHKIFEDFVDVIEEYKNKK